MSAAFRNIACPWTTRTATDGKAFAVDDYNLDSICSVAERINADAFTAAQTLRSRNSFTREDGTSLNYTLIHIDDWCRKSFEMVNQMRINTDNSHHRFYVVLLVNGVPVVQIDLKTLETNPARWSCEASTAPLHNDLCSAELKPTITSLQTPHVEADVAEVSQVLAIRHGVHRGFVRPGFLARDNGCRRRTGAVDP